ncbi:MAG: Hsp20 family protein [Pseudomonadota bacterium]
MRTYDFSPLFRSTVGFDRLVNLLDHVRDADVNQTAYPPYNIEKTGDDAYRITIAVAGFSDDELTVEAKDGQLTVAGRKAKDGDDAASFLHRGIAARAFERRFQLAEFVRADAARTENGLLHIDLVREVPEARKPRQIAINASPALEATAA